MPEAAQNNMIEMSAQEAESLKQAKALLDGLWNSKGVGAKFKRVLKEHNPNFSIPEIDIVDEAKKPIEDEIGKTKEELKALRDEIKADKDKAKEAKEESDLQAEINDVRKKFGLTDEGFDKMIKRMKDKKSYDPEAAAVWVKSQEPKTELARDSRLGLPGKINLFGSSTKDDAWKDLHDPNDPFKHFDKEVGEIFEHPENYKEMGGAL
jgi:hypothetical protein